MIYSRVIIVGGGPAGSSCGWRLKQNGIDCLILDRQPFPREKLCAGWITPDVIDDLKIDINEYPHSFTKFNNFRIHLSGKELEVRVKQYAIRRYEFDHWLLQRSGVNVETHDVKEIKKEGDYYLIDNGYYCTYLVGAGGSRCPVYKTFFKQTNPRHKDLAVATLEEEFPYDYHDENCHLCFFLNRLPGYAWYVPKRNGFVAAGIGGFLEKLKTRNDTIKNQWQLFTEELGKRSLVKDHDFRPGGSVYYIRNSVESVQKDDAFIIGDAAGLATRDMGEGIGPAVKSGILAAESISKGIPLSLGSVKKSSFPRYRTYAALILNAARSIFNTAVR